MDIGMRNYDLRTLIDDVEAEASSFLYREVCSGIEIWRCGCLPHSFKAFFADFPYELKAKTECHYQVVFYLVFKLMGQFCDAKVRGAKGRADAVVKTKDYIYVFEFKLDGSVKDALRQIDEKGYLLPYEADGRELVKIGVSFSKEDRNLGCWEIV